MLYVAPKAALTSSQNNWGVLYTELIKTALDGGTFEKDYTSVQRRRCHDLRPWRELRRRHRR
jgi:basic membrane lipoprotein Med (substrate-binding protein (PBP1-ABC) superfamily)